MTHFYVPVHVYCTKMILWNLKLCENLWSLIYSVCHSLMHWEAMHSHIDISDISREQCRSFPAFIIFFWIYLRPRIEKVTYEINSNLSLELINNVLQVNGGHCFYSFFFHFCTCCSLRKMIQWSMSISLSCCLEWRRMALDLSLCLCLQIPENCLVFRGILGDESIWKLSESIQMQVRDFLRFTLWW